MENGKLPAFSGLHGDRGEDLKSTSHDDKIKTRQFVAVFLLLVSPFLPNCGVHASMIDYGVYQVKASITDNGMHVVPTQIDSKTPGIWSTDANAFVADSFGSVSNSWSINFLNSNEAQVNINTFYEAPASDAYSSAGQAGEVHFNYHSDTAFTVNYYWNLTWGINDPSEFFNLNFFGQQIKLRIYDSQDNWFDPQWVPNLPFSYYPYSGNFTGSIPINLGAGDWLFIVFTSGSNTRWAGEWESISGNVYLDFDGGYRIPDMDFNDDGSVNLVDYSFFAQTWLLSTGQVGYLEVCDLVNDDVINLNDLRIFLEYWLAEL